MSRSAVAIPLREEIPASTFPVCPSCGTALASEGSIRRYAFGTPVGGAHYDEIQMIACRKCHRVLGVVR